MSTDATRYYNENGVDDTQVTSRAVVTLVSNVPYVILGFSPREFNKTGETSSSNSESDNYAALTLTLDITGVKKAIEAVKAANGGKFTYKAFVDYVATHTRNGEEVKRDAPESLLGHAVTFFLGRIGYRKELQSGRVFSTLDDPGIQRLTVAHTVARAFKAPYSETSQRLLELLEGVHAVKFTMTAVAELGDKVYPTVATFVNCLAKED